jgi:hypothetical protein
MLREVDKCESAERGPNPISLRVGDSDAEMYARTGKGTSSLVPPTVKDIALKRLRYSVLLQSATS